MSSSSFFGPTTNDLFDQAEPLETGGATCLCYRTRLYGQLHFIKRLKEELRTDPRYLAAMHKEFVAGYSLNHPNIVRYLAKGDDYVAMEYVDGERLSDFIVTHPDFFTSKSNTTRLLNQLLSAIEYLHQHGIVHLDLKPQNILITRVGQNVKVVDLGFCYTADFPDTMGRTDRYAAPEQRTNRNLPDERTDIYAFGRILEQLPGARRYRKIISRCTAPEPEQRYQSAQEAMAALQPPKRNWRILTAVALVAVLVAAFLLLWPRSNALVATPQSIDSIVGPNIEEPETAVPMAKEPTTDVLVTSSTSVPATPQQITTPTTAVQQEGNASPTPTTKKNDGRGTSKEAPFHHSTCLRFHFGASHYNAFQRKQSTLQPSG